MNSFHFVIFALYNTAANNWGGWESATVRGAQYLHKSRSVQFRIGWGSFYPLALSILPLSLISFNPILEPDTFFNILALFFLLGGVIVINAAYAPRTWVITGGAHKVAIRTAFLNPFLARVPSSA
jgi:hypothetical protein